MKKRFSSMSNIDVVKSYLAGERPYLTISMAEPERNKYRKDGEEWVVDGIRYKKQNGKVVKLTKTQGDLIRETIGDTLDCKICKLQWKWANSSDQKFLTRTGVCQDCLVEYETKLRILGIYDPYEKYRLASYELGYLKEKQIKLNEVLEYFSKNDGDIVKLSENEYDPNIVWKNTNKEKIVKDATKDLEKISQLVTNGNKLIKDYKKRYLDSLKQYKLPDIITKK